MSRSAVLEKAPLRSASVLTGSNAMDFAYKSIEEAFPKIDPGLEPFGTCAVFQIRLPKIVTAGGIIVPEESQSTEYYNTQVAKVISVGPLAFKSVDKETGELVTWPEGIWFKPGDFVRVPKYGGDRFEVNFDEVSYVGGEKVTHRRQVIFAIFKVKDTLGLVSGDPLKIKAYLD